MNARLKAALHPFAQRRAARIEKYVQSESIEYERVIDTRRRGLDEEVKRLKVAHHAKYVGGVSAPGLLESTLLPVWLEYLRDLVTAHIEIRARLGQECPDLLSADRLDKLEEEMTRTVDTFRMSREGKYKRRVAASGFPEPRSLHREDAEYGDVVALIRHWRCAGYVQGIIRYGTRRMIRRTGRMSLDCRKKGPPASPATPARGSLS